MKSLSIWKVIMKQVHKNKRKSTRVQTKERRKHQICKVYCVKFDKSHLSKEKKSHLKMLFIEAKWLYNYILSQSKDKAFDLFKDYDNKNKNVITLDKDKKFIVRTLSYLSAQMRFALYDRTKNNIIALSRSKKKGNNIGRLKFKSRINTIPLPQFNSTYKIKPNKKYIKLRKFKKDFKVSGLEQIPIDAEIANAILIKRQDDYYIHIVTYQAKETKIYKEKHIGIDFGIRDNVTLSNGEKFNIKVSVSKRTIKLHKQLSKKKKGSKNRYKAIDKLNRAYQKTNNQKKDKKNKVVHYITNTFETVVVQDESIKQWQSSLFGKQVQNSALGGIMNDLKRKSYTFVVVDKYFPSTKKCLLCGKKNILSLSNRVYRCSCGYKNDRDIHAANNILAEGLKQNKILTEHKKFKPVENSISSRKSSRTLSEKQEAKSLVLSSSLEEIYKVTEYSESSTLYE